MKLAAVSTFNCRYLLNIIDQKHFLSICVILFICFVCLFIARNFRLFYQNNIWREIRLSRFNSVVYQQIFNVNESIGLWNNNNFNKNCFALFCTFLCVLDVWHAQLIWWDLSARIDKNREKIDKILYDKSDVYVINKIGFFWRMSCALGRTASNISMIFRMKAIASLTFRSAPLSRPVAILLFLWCK